MYEASEVECFSYCDSFPSPPWCWRRSAKRVRLREGHCKDRLDERSPSHLPALPSSSPSPTLLVSPIRPLLLSSSSLPPIPPLPPFHHPRHLPFLSPTVHTPLLSPPPRIFPPLPWRFFSICPPSFFRGSMTFSRALVHRLGVRFSFGFHPSFGVACAS